MRHKLAVLLVTGVALGAAPGFAKVLDTSPRPLPRPLPRPERAIDAQPDAAQPGAQSGAQTAGPSAGSAFPAAPLGPAASASAFPAQPGAAPPQAFGAHPELAAIRPLPKPASAAAPQAEPAPAADPRLAGFRPKPRPPGLAGLTPPDLTAPETAPPEPVPEPAPETAAAPQAKPSPGGVLGRLFGPAKKPRPKPDLPAGRSEAAAPQSRAETSLRGSVCGVPGIIGQTIPDIGTPGRGCGVEDPVKITSVSGIKLSQPMTVDCATATAFKRWVDRGIVPAVGGKGGGIARFEVGPGYVCRPRNGVRGAKISEHGHGKAIDLMGLTLKNGQTIDVLSGWRKQPRILKAMHASACGIFGTVLGPKSDRYHQDHIHVDTARYRSGTYCR